MQERQDFFERLASSGKGEAMFWLKKPVVLKDGLHDGELEPEELVEINILHVQARRTRRAGDLPGSLIFEHHCQEAIRRSNRFIVYDTHQDRWREYRGKR